MVHPAQLMDVCSPCCSERKAVATIVKSIDIISKARATIVNTSTRRTGRLASTATAAPLAAEASVGAVLLCMFQTFNVLREPPCIVPSYGIIRADGALHAAA